MADEVAEVSGEEVEAEDEGNWEDDGNLAKDMEEAHLAEYEEGWSTDGEDDDDLEMDGEIEKKLANGKHVPLREVTRDIHARSEESQRETPRTRVLSVTELEDLFINAAPSLAGMSSFPP